MLRFQVFPDALSPAGQPPWALRHAHAISPDDLPEPAHIALEAGIISVAPAQETSCALALQYPVPELGVLTVRTCLLKQRDKPYLLTLELARHRVMQLLNKLEEWALFDRAPDEPAMAMVERARGAFTAALHAIPNRPGPFTIGDEELAREALRRAFAAGERLALLAAKTHHSRRLSGELERIAAKPLPPSALTDHEARQARSLSSGTPGVILLETPRVGVAISTASCTPELQQAACVCDYVSIPMRWIDMEPTEGKYAFAKVDKWVEWAVLRAKVPVVGGPVLDLSPRAVPQWLYLWENDYDALREGVLGYLKAVIGRYRKGVTAWTVCTGLHVGSNFSLSYDQTLDLTRLCVLACKKLHPGARVIVEIEQPWSEYAADAPPVSAVGKNAGRTLPPHVYLEMLKQLAVPLDGVGVRMQMGCVRPGRSTRDLLEFSAMLDTLGELHLPISVTALGCPAAPPSEADLGEGAAHDPGYYAQPWSPQSQAQWLRLFGSVVSSKCYVQSVCWQDLYDTNGGEMLGSGLCAANAVARPVHEALSELRAALKDRRELLPGFAGV